MYKDIKQGECALFYLSSKEYIYNPSLTSVSCLGLGGLGP